MCQSCGLALFGVVEPSVAVVSVQDAVRAARQQCAAYWAADGRFMQPDL